MPGADEYRIVITGVRTKFMTFEELEQKVKNANVDTEWQQLHSEALALLKTMSDEERRNLVTTGKWSVIESISMSVLYPRE